jgi:glucosylceramidase
MALLQIILLASLLTTFATAASDCKPRKFNHDSIVCVCDESQCDSLDPLEKSAAGIIQIFESTRDGKRFEKRLQAFNDDVNPPTGYQWNLTIDRSQQYQDVIGFGGAFSDAAALSIASLPVKQQVDLLSSYYGDTGIEYNVGRVVISGCDFSNRPYTYNDAEWDWELTNFAFVAEDTDYKIPQMKLAQLLSPSKLKFFASSWSPPAWLKNNREINHGGSLNEGPGSVFWKTYARYLLKFFDGYKAQGIDWWGMTVQNEPGIWNTDHPWNTCAFTPEMEKDFVKTDLGPILEQGGYPPENFTIMSLDHNRDFLPGWAQTVFADPEASRYIKGTAVHWYGNMNVPATTYDRVHELFPDKFIFATEACTSGPYEDRIALGSWSIGEEYAHDILRDLNHWVSGWTDWNLALDMEGGVNWVQNFQSAPIIVNAESQEFYKNPSFYAMGHFSKFLPENSKRIRSSSEIMDNERFQVGAFLRPDGGIVVIAVSSWDDNNVLVINDESRGTVKINVEPHSFISVLYY